MSVVGLAVVFAMSLLVFPLIPDDFLAWIAYQVFTSMIRFSVDLTVDNRSGLSV